MRPLKEIIQDIIDFYENNYPKICDGLGYPVIYGLCHAILLLNIKDLLKYGEGDLFIEYFRFVNRDQNEFFDWRGELTEDRSQFYWKPGDIESRIQWLKDHLEILSGEEFKFELQYWTEKNDEPTDHYITIQACTFDHAVAIAKLAVTSTARKWFEMKKTKL